LYFLYFLHKKPFFNTQEIENDLFMPRKGEHPNKHCLQSQKAYMCTLLGHLNKLCHGFGHDPLIWLESHVILYMVAHSRKEFSRIFSLDQVYYFPGN
jgi:hypothetical protein